MSASFGIDLGTTNSSISWLVDGRPVAIAVGGHAIVPSVVLFEQDRVVVGREAKNLELKFPEATVRSVKRRMGEPHLYKINGRELSPEDVSAQILGTLKRGAEEATGLSISDVVITVPAYFDDSQRRATLKAGELAGLNVLRLLNEPTSASLVYDRLGAAEAPVPEIVMIYDLGGGTFDVSVLEIFEGVREVRATTGNSHLGGDDFDLALVRLFLDELKVSRKVDPSSDPRAMARLRRLAEDTKIRLSADTEFHVKEEFLTTDEKGQPVHFDLHVTRRRFEDLIRPLLASTIELARRALEEAKLSGQILGRLCLVGGSTRIPLCRALLAAAFEVDIHEEIDPDLAVALGASMQAGLLTGARVERILVDVASHSLGVSALGDDDPEKFVPVIRRNTVLPAQRTEELYTAIDRQERIHVEVFQGEAPRAPDNTLVGSFDFDLRPVPEGSPVRVEFAYDLNGVVMVQVSQPGTGNVKAVALSVADAHKKVPGGALGAVEKKARQLLAEELDPEARKELQGLLDAYLATSGAARERAEETLLDLFLDLDDEGELEGE